MKMTSHNMKYIGFIIALCMVGGVSGQEPVFPVPQGNPNQLFYIQHSPNANTIIYEANYKNGVLDSKEPIHVYWIKFAERGQKSELNMIQRNYAYGIITTKVTDDSYDLRLISYKTRVLHLKKGENNKYAVYTVINQKPAILLKIFLKISGGHFLSPNIEYAELTGVHPDNGTVTTERLKMNP